MSKPARLYKKEPITVTLTPEIILAGAFIIIVMLSLSMGFNDNYIYLLNGI